MRARTGDIVSSGASRRSCRRERESSVNGLRENVVKLSYVLLLSRGKHRRQHAL
jgi:hypothetical protein